MDSTERTSCLLWHDDENKRGLTVTLDDIKQKAEKFFEWPAEDHSQVTFTSALLFADYCVQDYKEKERGAS
jgi:hypothetical protein